MSCLIIKDEKDIKIVLSKKIFEHLRACIKNAYPNEACGIIFGEVIQTAKDGKDDFIYHYKANNFECIKSDRKSAVSFLIENIEKLHEIIQDKLKIEKKKRLISIFHSHPSGSYPSSTDLEQMKFLDDFSSTKHRFMSKAFKNLIWTIMDGINYDLRGFIYINPDFFQIKVIIREEPYY